MNENFENALRYKNAYEENSRMGMFLYVIMLTFSIVGAILNNNGFPAVGKFLLVIGVLAIILFLITFVKTLSSQSNFYKVLGKKVMANSVVLVIIGIPLYFLYFIYFNRKMKEDLKQIR